MAFLSRSLFKTGYIRFVQLLNRNDEGFGDSAHADADAEIAAIGLSGCKFRCELCFASPSLDHAPQLLQVHSVQASFSVRVEDLSGC